MYTSHYRVYGEVITRSIDRRRQRVSNVLLAHHRCSARLAWPQILRMQPPRGMQSSILRGNTPMTALRSPLVYWLRSCLITILQKPTTYKIHFLRFAV